MNNALINPYKSQWATIKGIWLQKKLFGAEKYFLIGLAALLMILPAMLVRYIGGKFGYHGRKFAIEAWALSKPVAWAIVLYYGLRSLPFLDIVVIVGLVDLYAYLVGLVFLREYYSAPASYGRSVLMLGINLIESIFSFAILYLHYRTLTTGAVRAGIIESGRDAVYFSTVTAATVGYGDIKPCNGTGQILVVLQILCTFAFVTVVLTSFVSNLSLSGEKARGITAGQKN